MRRLETIYRPLALDAALDSDANRRLPRFEWFCFDWLKACSMQMTQSAFSFLSFTVNWSILFLCLRLPRERECRSCEFKQTRSVAVEIQKPIVFTSLASDCVRVHVYCKKRVKCILFFALNFHFNLVPNRRRYVVWIRFFLFFLLIKCAICFRVNILSAVILSICSC